jgi:hypothetical protein
VGFDARDSQPVNERLHGLPVHSLDIVLCGEDTEPRARGNVARNDMRARDVQHVNRRSG